MTNGPVNSRAAIIFGSWWFCREVELSTARAALFEFTWVDARWRATIHLPVSETDQMATGIARGFGCQCSAIGELGRPVCTLVEHVLFLRRRFAHRFLEASQPWTSHFFLHLLAL